MSDGGQEGNAAEGGADARQQDPDEGFLQLEAAAEVSAEDGQEPREEEEPRQDEKSGEEESKQNGSSEDCRCGQPLEKESRTPLSGQESEERGSCKDDAKLR